MADFREALWPALPEGAGALAGRVWRPDQQGPAVVAVRDGELFDITATFPTMRDLCEAPDPAGVLAAARGESLGTFVAALANTPAETRNPARPWLLAPIDLQAIKAAGVTFPISMLERVIEERARGGYGLSPMSGPGFPHTRRPRAAPCWQSCHRRRCGRCTRVQRTCLAVRCQARGHRSSCDER